MGTGEIAEVADADKASGQHVLAKAAQELDVTADSVVEPNLRDAQLLYGSRLLCFVSGHDFSRAANGLRENWALAREGYSQQFFP